MLGPFKQSLQRKRHIKKGGFCLFARQSLLILTLESEVYYMSNHTDPHFEESHSGEVRSWIQENLRIIVSIFIVAAIALGIYSYSQRSENLSDEDIASLLETKGGEENAMDKTNDSMTGDDTAMEAAMEPSSKGTVVTPELSQETEAAYTEVAENGDGLTHLARRAMNHALEQNGNTELNAEQKVFVEDYLRKNIASQSVTPGSSVEFSKDIIAQAIGQAQALTPQQIQNLSKYAARVSAYR